MATTITKYYTASTDLSAFITDFTALWDWAAVETTGNTTVFYVDEAKTKGFTITNNGTQWSAAGAVLRTQTNTIGTSGAVLSIVAVKTATALAVGFTFSTVATTVLASHYRLAVCTGTNQQTQQEETILLLKTGSGGNYSYVMVADDVAIMNAQPSITVAMNQSLTALVPVHNQYSFVLPDVVYQPLACQESSLRLGSVTLNGEKYAMCFDLFLLEEASAT